MTLLDDIVEATLTAVESGGSVSPQTAASLRELAAAGALLDQQALRRTLETSVLDESDCPENDAD